MDTDEVEDPEDLEDLDSRGVRVGHVWNVMCVEVDMILIDGSFV